jgi:hypothetical protein
MLDLQSFECCAFYLVARQISDSAPRETLLFWEAGCGAQAKQLYGNTVFLPAERKFASPHCTDCQVGGIPASCQCAGGEGRRNPGCAGVHY